LVTHLFCGGPLASRRVILLKLCRGGLRIRNLLIIIGDEVAHQLSVRDFEWECN
jgi:hypothetical protein